MVRGSRGGTVIGTPEQVRCRIIARQVVTEYARDKVTKALYEAVLEGLEFGPRNLPLQEDREWIRGAIAVPLHEAAGAALEVLSRSVGRTLERAPSGLLDRFERSNQREALSFE
jgi:hypothetical protein